MRWEPIPSIKDCGILHYDRYDDERGYFQELYNRKAMADVGIPLPWAWAQDNTSFSRAGVLRGLHLQRVEPQGKLVTCLVGRIVDVCLDLRRDSPTYLALTRVVLDQESPCSFWLPPGTAHGFAALTDSLIHYRCSSKYDKESDGGINPFSPELAEIWPLGKYQLSTKDQALPKLVDYTRTFA